MNGLTALPRRAQSRATGRVPSWMPNPGSFMSERRARHCVAAPSFPSQTTAAGTPSLIIES